MNKIWSIQERLDVINAIAYVGMSYKDSYYFILIGLVATATPEFLNADKEICLIAQDVELLKSKLLETNKEEKIPFVRACKQCSQIICDCTET
jgi:hypothetical protein